MSWFEAPEATLPSILALHGRWRGARTAAIEGEQRVSWREFDAQTARAAHGLRALGLRDGDRVALLMDNSLEMLVLLLGILRAGCVAVPLNVSIHDSAVAGMIADAGARAVFASATHGARIEALGREHASLARTIRVGLKFSAPGWLDFENWFAAQTGRYEGAVEPHQHCNIIYSSGTTGVPKGIVHTHGCRMQWAVHMSSALRYRSDCVTLLSLGLFSNITWVAMLATVLVGGTMVVMPHFNAAAALKLMAAENITHGTLVPLQLERLLALTGGDAPQPLSLDTLMCCGSPLPIEIKREFPRRFRCRLIELYGLTEGLCTILSPEDFAAKTASVGKPFLGSDVKIVAEDDREAPRGATGEVVGRGPLLMAGYHDNPEASAAATWTDAAGRRWLRTGDLGRLDEEGFLYIVDRKKDMILSGGQNIYPADIEAVMRTHPCIADVAVLGVPSAQWGETPVAVIVARGVPAPPVQELMEWTNARVGKQQRIRWVVLRDALPRNANGKVLKRELRRELRDLTL